MNFLYYQGRKEEEPLYGKPNREFSLFYLGTTKSSRSLLDINGHTPSNHGISYFLILTPESAGQFTASAGLCC